jgi:hypothetical protein
VPNGGTNSVPSKTISSSGAVGTKPESGWTTPTARPRTSSRRPPDSAIGRARDSGRTIQPLRCATS